MARLPLTLAALAALLFSSFAGAQTPESASAESADDARTGDSAAGETQSAEAPRYLQALRAELERLDLAASCEVLDALRARCSWRVQNSERTRELTLRALLDESTHTLYLYASIAAAHPDDTETSVVLRRVAELNWRYLASKLEWNSATGEVRISALQHLDTNFDRRAFRVLVRLLGRQSMSAAAEIERLIPRE